MLGQATMYFCEVDRVQGFACLCLSPNACQVTNTFVMTENTMETITWAEEGL